MTAQHAAPETPEIRKPAKAPRGPSEAYTAEDLGLVYLRQARTAVVTLAVIAVAGVIASLILGIVLAVSITHENNLLNQISKGSTTSSNCMSQGGTGPSC